MKKGDIISFLSSMREKGTSLAEGFTTREQAEAWACEQGIPWELQKIDNLSFQVSVERWKVVSTVAFEVKERAKVNWVVDEEMGITILDTGLSRICSIKGWRVEVEAAPSFQSSVEDMSEEELRASLESLREVRESTPKPKSKLRNEEKIDPMAKLISSLSPEKRQALMEKLGLV